jgi:hypothetical protein
LREACPVAFAAIVLSRLRPHLTYANVGVTMLFVLAGTGWAVAAIPGPGGVVNACFDKRTGTLRVIDSKRHCTRRERAIRWNQQGRPGVTGTAGKQGNPGSDAQFTGAAAGGDLTGTYPNPDIRSGTINGTDVAPNSLTGNEVDESTLGQVPDSAKLGGVFANQFSRSEASTAFSAAPGSASQGLANGLSVNVSCISSPAAGNSVSVHNGAGHPISVWIDDSRGLPGSTPHVNALANNGNVSTDTDTTANVVRTVTINAGFPAVTAVVTVTRETASPAGCYSMIHGLS